MRDDVAVPDGAECDYRPPDPGPEGRKVLPVDECDDEAGKKAEPGGRQQEEREDAPLGDGPLRALAPA
jgi:hypothetical protein